MSTYWGNDKVVIHVNDVVYRLRYDYEPSIKNEDNVMLSKDNYILCDKYGIILITGEDD